ncbi:MULTISPECIES: DUF2759 domain-containing protein [Aneurinibacillus]|nr:MULTISPECIES: DUF2759 domain-containing protein [Aneurinibacillus]MED0675541.1 DUF2759 domain-containing protein [Aneurinibacillus thermoaerophilus]MED0680308.1 DUF2759 domain-containing protein [Aneurinibacillus thermoaerophilus]MED0737065.1 DUF2759 domain-containing protein [Aneurinibacillus thermoaerophilus]MED0757365.1 DUF2759 domain-containing protein [Aneurinibacillus thermoaerophilus]MED0762098.1 DUF2759 domain-containing protein [Aneurinibacillus thermoaerophilus]
MLMNILMFIFTFFVAWGLRNVTKQKNKFGMVFTAIALAVCIFADVLIVATGFAVP